MKLIRVRPQANQDIDIQVEYLANESLQVAIRYIDNVEATYLRIAEHPLIGSTRYAHLPLLANLRVWPVSKFENYLVFYIDRSQYVDVIRILHAAQDIPAILQTSFEVN